MPTQHARNADLTGRMRAQGQKAHADELAARDAEITTTAGAADRALETEVVDYSSGGPVILDAKSEPVEVSDEWRVIRTNEDLEDVTIGVGNLYTFKAGQKTKVSAVVADHLEELGYIWH